MALGRELAPERSRLSDDLLERAADDERRERADRFDADFVAAADGEREPVPLEIAVGFQNDVGRRVVRIRDAWHLYRPPCAMSETGDR